MKSQLWIVQAMAVVMVGVLVVPTINAFTPAGVGRSQFLSLRSSSSSSEETQVLDPFTGYKAGSELAWKDVTEGTGEAVEEGDVLTVSYSGYLFSTRQQFGKTEGLTFKLGGGTVMPGFDQGIRGIKEGGKRIIRIPPELAYQDRGAGNGKIPPNSDLEIDVEVTKVYRGVMGFVPLVGQNRLILFVILLAISIGAPMIGVGEKGFI